VKLDKSDARRRHLQQKGNSYEKEMDISTAGSVGRKRKKHFGGGVVRAFRAQRARGDLAICRPTGDADLAGGDPDRTDGGEGNSLVKLGLFDNE